MATAIVLACWMMSAASAWDAQALSGTVRDQSGASIADALVIVRTPGAPDVSVRTAPDGRFTLPNAARDATLVVTAAGFSEYRAVVRRADAATDLQIVLALAPVSSAVTVTAGRVEQRIADVPAQVSVVTAAAVDRSPAMMIDDVLRQIPAFSLFRRSSSVAAHPTAQGVSLRGIGPSGVSRTLVLLDGVPMNDPFGGWISWARVPSSATGRIEIVEGSSANLFGSSALGGAINIITAEPGGRSLGLEVRYAERGTARVDLTSGVQRGRVSIFADGAVFRTSGYPVVRDDERGAVDTRVSLEFANAAAALRYRITDGAHAYARGSYLDESRGNGKRSTFDDTTESNDTRWASASTGARVRTHGGSDVQAGVSIDRVRFWSNFMAVPAAVPARSIGRMTLGQYVPSTGVSASAQWSRALRERQLLTAGADWRFVEGESREDLLDTASGRTVVGRRFSGGSQNSAGIFIQDVFTPIPRISLTLALRHDRWSNRDGHNLEINAAGAPMAGNRPTLPDASDQVTRPRAAVLVRATGWLSAWGSVGFGFRAPTLNELYRQFRVGSVTTLANEALGPERLRTVEGGVRLAAGAVQWRATWFDNSLDDAVANVTVSSSGPSITQQRQNLGRTRIRGFETGAHVRLSNHLTLSAAYLHNDAVVTAFAPNPLLIGKRLPQVPRHRGSAQLMFTHPGGADLALSVQATGRQFDDDLNVRVVPGSNEAGLPAYAVLDVMASKSMGRKFRVFAGAQNLTNREFVAGTLPTTVGAPRSVTVGVRLRLGRRR